MTHVIGIRHETKNRWERRAPLTPDHVRELIEVHDLDVRVEPSTLRAFPDIDYRAAGARLAGDLSECSVIFGVKEVPATALLPGATYVNFPHVTKGQAYNMATLQAYIDRGCTLIDYELVHDRRGRRLIFFGRHAGYAGMLDSLWALGQRLAAEGFVTPLEEVRLAHQYEGLDEAIGHLARLGERIRHTGLAAGLRPIVIAFLGSGNVSHGAREIVERLPVQSIEPEDLIDVAEDRDRPRNVLYTTVLERHHRLRRRDGGEFDPAEYAAHPTRYESALAPLLPHITVLVNGVFWEPGLPKLVTADHLRSLWRGEGQPKLRVIGDITCDIDGSIEATVRATTPGDPTYVWDPSSGEIRPGVEGPGPVVMAVDNLPCELPVDASEHFGDSLLRFVPPLARCDWSVPTADLDLPRELRDAIIVHNGRLTPPYQHLNQFLAGA